MSQGLNLFQKERDTEMKKENPKNIMFILLDTVKF